MSELTQLGMTDVASRPRTGRAKLLCGLSFLLVLVYVVLRNAHYVNSGMLAPNFRVIHKAYDFNLFELPLTLIGLALLFGGLAITWVGARKVFVWTSALYLFFAADLFALRYYVTYVEPQRLVLRTVRIETPKVERPIRILHLSDIQSGGIGEYEQRMFDRIAELEPDLILNTGDYLQVVPPATFEEEIDRLIALFRTYEPPLGLYGVFGDTELELYRVSAERVAPMELLSSRAVLIDTGAGKLNIHGLSLFQSQKIDWAERSVEHWLESSGGSAFRILMGHSPNYALAMMDKPIDLCLAGHTHGGQVRLPFVGALTTYSDVPRDWARGFRRIGVPFLNVSAGAGSNRRHGLPPLRFNCPTEMTLIELVPLRSIL